MNSEEMKTLIRKKTQELISVLEHISDTGESDKPGHFHFDLTKEKLINLYNLVCEFQDMPVHQQAVEFFNPSPVLEQTEPVEEIAEQVAEEIYKEEPTSISSQENTLNDEGFAELPEGFEVAEEHHESAVQLEMVMPAEQAEENEEKSHSEAQAQQPVHDINPAAEPKQILSDKFQKDTHSVHQKFNSGRDETSVSSRLQSHPLPDLRKAIGINDRFSFITELFSGNKNDFELYLNDICAMSSSEEVLDRFSNTTDEKQWQSKPSYSKFRDLVQRYALSK